MNLILLTKQPRPALRAKFTELKIQFGSVEMIKQVEELCSVHVHTLLHGIIQ